MPRKTDWVGLIIDAKIASDVIDLKAAQTESDRINREVLRELKKSNERAKTLQKSQEREQKRQKRQRKICRWLEEFTVSVQSVIAMDEIVLRLQTLFELKNEADKVYHGEFDESELERRYLDLSAVIEQAIGQTVTELGQANIALLTGFNVQLPLIKQGVIQLTEERACGVKTLPEEQGVAVWRGRIGKLEQAAQELRRLDENADQVHLELHPDFKFVEIAERLSARIELDMFVLKCAVLIIKADKEVSRTEQIAFDHLRRRMMVPAADANEIFETTRQIKPKDFSGDKDDALMLVKSLANVVFADGVMHKRELAMLKAISKAVGITESQLEEIVEQAADNPAIRMVDGNKLIESFTNSSFKDMKNICFGEDIPAKLLESVGFVKEQAAANGEFPVVSYSNKLLGMTVGSILVSDKRLFQKSGSDEPTEPLNLVDIVQVEEGGSVFSTTIAIKTSSQEIKVPNFFMKFLVILKQSLPQLTGEASR